MTRATLLAYGAILAIGIAAGVILAGCAGTPVKRAADAGSVTVAATSAARVELVAWTIARDRAIPEECRAACATDARAVACFDECAAAKVGIVDRVRTALAGYRLALEAAASGAAGDLAGVAAGLVRMAQEVTQ